MPKLSLRPALTLLSAVAVALAIATSAVAQAPPSTPHQFFGSEPTGSGALLDGAPAPDGAVVTAWNQDGVAALSLQGGDQCIVAKAAAADHPRRTGTDVCDSQPVCVHHHFLKPARRFRGRPP